MGQKLGQAVALDADNGEDRQRQREDNDQNQPPIEGQRQVHQRDAGAGGQNGGFHGVAQPDAATEDRAGVDEILWDEVDIPPFALRQRHSPSQLKWIYVNADTAPGRCIARSR